MAKIILEPGDRVKIKKTGEIRTVESHTEGMQPPISLKRDDGLYFIDDLVILFPGDFGFKQPPAVRAETHDDDRRCEVPFDAQEWFEKASDKEILDLAECGWGGDEPPTTSPCSLRTSIRESVTCSSTRERASSAMSMRMTP